LEWAIDANFVASFAGDFVAFVESNRESAREGAKVFFLPQMSCFAGACVAD
jgi:hypothetical protein